MNKEMLWIIKKGWIPTLSWTLGFAFLLIAFNSIQSVALWVVFAAAWAAGAMSVVETMKRGIKDIEEFEEIVEERNHE